MRDWEGELSEKPYRIIAVPGSLILHNFAEVIVGSFDLEFDSPFGFQENIERWEKSTAGYELLEDRGEGSRFTGERKTKIEDLFHELGKEMLFVYDYKDEWHFSVQLIKIEEYPCIIERVGESPSQ